MHHQHTPSIAADTSINAGIGIRYVSPVVSNGPTMAPVLPPAAIMLKSLVPWSGLKISAMKLQKTETTKRLNTESQTKKTRAIHCGATWLDIRRKNATRWLAKKAYTESSNRSRGIRADT